MVQTGLDSRPVASARILVMAVGCKDPGEALCGSGEYIEQGCF